VDLDDFVQCELLGRKLGVALVGLASLVGRGPLHLGDRADDAVHAEAARLPAEGKAGDAGLVDCPGRLDRKDRVGDGGGVVGERASRRSRP